MAKNNTVYLNDAYAVVLRFWEDYKFFPTVRSATVRCIGNYGIAVSLQGDSERSLIPDEYEGLKVFVKILKDPKD